MHTWLRSNFAVAGMNNSSIPSEDEGVLSDPMDTNLPELEEIADLDIPLTAPVDVASYLNSRFPTETHLKNNLGTYLNLIDAALRRLDVELAGVAHNHRNDTEVITKGIGSSLQSLSTAETSLSALKMAAETAKDDLNNALAPASPVYTALENSRATAVAIEALVTLDDAVRKLEAAASSPALDTISSHLNVFTSVRESLSSFESQPAPQKLPELRARASVATETLRSKVLTEFRRYSDVLAIEEESSSRTNEAVKRLQTACLVAEAMGTITRAEVVGFYIKSRKAAFRAAFEMDKNGFAGTDKRLAWLRKELRANWARLGGETRDKGWGRVFPGDWGVARRVAEGIVGELRDWTIETLDAGADRDVAVMIRGLSRAKEFEEELDRRFGVKGDSSFVGIISRSFEPWMGAYIKQEDEHLRIVLAELLRDETWVCQDSSVLRSGTELFRVIKKSMVTCASLDIGQPLFSLHRVFRKNLSKYAALLVRYLPRSQNKVSNSNAASEFDARVQRACAIINTAEYCCNTVEQLEESLRRTVEDVFSKDIDLSAEREQFSAVSAKGVQAIVVLIDEDLENELKSMSSQTWSSWPEVGDTSVWVQGIGNKLTASSNVLASMLERHHFRFFLEKMAVSFVTRFRKHIYKCEQMNNFGAQQLLLDSSALKSVLLSLPVSVQVPVPAAFVKHVNRGMGKVEAMLKVILAPRDASVDTYEALVPDGTAEDLQRILEMKGLRRGDAAPLVLDYSRRIGPTQRLNSSQRYVTPVSSPSPVIPEEKPLLKSIAASAGTQPVQGATSASQSQNAAVDSVISLFDRLGSSLKESGITDRIDQVSSQFESTTDRLRKEAAARGFRFT